MYPWDGKNVYFMGFMASGKSAIGKEFAFMLGRRFADTDDLVEEYAGKSISQIFADDGEEAFRVIETSVIRTIAESNDMIISLGGGAILREENWNLIEQSGISVCLSAPVKTLAERIARKSHRPLMYNLQGDALIAKINTMLEERQPFYQRAQYIFENSGSLSIRDFSKHIYTTIRDDI